jgi:hypothetical protein
MKVTFISHAGFITDINGIKILTDPWTMGKAFNDGWALMAKAGTVDYSTIDYIFFSHEHPDHFHFPTLKNIPENLRENITILYQEHASERLVKAFGKLKFKKVIQLPIYKWFTLNNDIQLYCGSSGSMDSFLAIKSNEQTLLNLNDCVFNKKQYAYIKRQVGNVDLLFTQFSFANWVGNDKDEYDQCGKKIEDIKTQIEIFKPQYTVPFASFVYFCNEENARMNAWMNTPEKIYNLKLPTINFMYPNDTIDVQQPKFFSEVAVEKYINDLKSITIDPTPPTVSFDEICGAIKENLSSLKQKVKKPIRSLAKPFGVYIRDIDKAIFVDPYKSIFHETTKEQCKYEVCSQVCWYTFKYSWGTGTLEVSGMYLDRKMNEPTSKYFFLQNMISTEFLLGGSLSALFRTGKFLWRKKWEIFYRYR